MENDNENGETKLVELEPAKEKKKQAPIITKTTKTVEIWEYANPNDPSASNRRLVERLEVSADAWVIMNELRAVQQALAVIAQHLITQYQGNLAVPQFGGIVPPRRQ